MELWKGVTYISFSRKRCLFSVNYDYSSWGVIWLVSDWTPGSTDSGLRIFILLWAYMYHALQVLMCIICFLSFNGNKWVTLLKTASCEDQARKTVTILITKFNLK